MPGCRCRRCGGITGQRVERMAEGYESARVLLRLRGVSVRVQERQIEIAAPGEAVADPERYLLLPRRPMAIALIAEHLRLAPAVEVSE